jgi:predicted ATPase with chaperone activity
MTVAAAGRHSLLLIGSPGLGKTMACDRFAGLLPDLEAEAAIQSASLLSMCGLAVQPQAMVHPPVRKPDCTITPAGFFGGGRPPKPGEISLAQNGVLIMDEFPLFSPEIINQLRFAMENRYIELSRGNRIWRYPADFQLIASMNPCPCGYHKDPFHSCSCTSKQIIRYLQRVPQPILDRFDMIYALKASYGYGQEAVENGRTRVGSSFEELKAGGQADAVGQASGTFGSPAGLAGPAAPPPVPEATGKAADEGPQQENVGSLLDLASYGKTTAEMRTEVLQARAIQADRYQGLACRWNGEYQVAADPSLLAVSPAGEAFYLKLARKYSLSRRAFFRLLKVAWTLADLSGSPTIEPAHIMEALHYYQARYTYWPG